MNDLQVAEDRLRMALLAIAGAKKKGKGAGYRGYIRLARLLANQAVLRLEKEQTK